MSLTCPLLSAEPPFIQERPELGFRAAEGQTIQLRCKVFGSPKPQVVWKKGDEQLTGGRYRVLEDGNLEISVSPCNLLQLASSLMLCMSFIC